MGIFADRGPPYTSPENTMFLIVGLPIEIQNSWPHVGTLAKTATSSWLRVPVAACFAPSGGYNMLLYVGMSGLSLRKLHV